MTSIQQIALQLSGGFLVGVCVWLWLERKRRIRRAKELKRLDGEIAGLLRRLKEVNAEIEAVNVETIKQILSGVELKSEVGK